MKAALFRRVGERLAIHDVERPKIGHDELLLKVALTGICGSDLHAADTPGVLPPGAILGQEFTGEVVESTSPDWRIGERVAVNPHWICEVCAGGGKCHSGRDADYTNACFMGFKLEVPGAYAELVRVRASQAIRLPDNVSLRDGALMEPVAVARHAVDACGQIRGSSVLVIGGGPIGLGVLLMAIDAGAANVIVSEPDASRGACALQVGAAAVIDPTTEDLPSALVHIGIGAPEVVFECVAAPGLLQQTIDVMAKRARAVIVGVCMTADHIMPRAAIHKGATLKFVLGYMKGDFGYASRYLSLNTRKAAAMISKVVPLDALPEVFDQLRSQKSLIKVLTTPVV